MLDFKQRNPTDDQLAIVKAAFKYVWQPVNDVPKTKDLDERYQLIMQHPEMRQRFLNDCIKKDFWTNIPGSIVVVDQEFRALNILFQLHRDGNL